MARPIKLKINYSRIVLDHLYHGKNGQYLDLVAWPNKNGPDQYGNTHMVCQELSREAREAGEKGPILGNLRLPEGEALGRATTRQNARKRPIQRRHASSTNRGQRCGRARINRQTRQGWRATTFRFENVFRG